MKQDVISDGLKHIASIIMPANKTKSENDSRMCQNERKIKWQMN